MQTKCPYCQVDKNKTDIKKKIRRAGRFWRKSDGRWISRFRCLACEKSFSRASLSRKCWQKKRHMNESVRRILCAGVSMRESARVLNLNRKTIARKLLFLAEEAQIEFEVKNALHPKAVEVEFDELETFEHTKCKPLSVPLMVEYKTRRILGFEVAEMPAKGRLAAYSRKKYGPRRDQRPMKRKLLLERMQRFVYPKAKIRSDSHPLYPQEIAAVFPQAFHERILGGRGATTGQGELKKVKWDPIFSLNHTCAMLRAHLARLIRKTWNTTKKPERLAAHLMIYITEHNRRVATI